MNLNSILMENLFSSSQSSLSVQIFLMGNYLEIYQMHNETRDEHSAMKTEIVSMSVQK